MEDQQIQAREVDILVGDLCLAGSVCIPAHARTIVVFAHGSGSSRFSPRNLYVASVLQEAGLGTLLMDLLTSAEEQIDARTGHFRFDIDFLAQRLVAATVWLKANTDTKHLGVAYFGASTGAAAALVAAAFVPEQIVAIVSRGGRPDLADEYLPRVQAPTLLIVGGKDEPVISLNEQAFRQLRCEKHFVIVPGATHLFEEKGTLEQVAELACDWFMSHQGSESRNIS